MHRFFVLPEQIRDGRVRLTGEQARQIVRVLRLGVGDRIVVLDGRGSETEAEIVQATPAAVEAAVVDQRPCTTEPTVQLTLYQALLKRDKFEWVLQKGTEVGVARIVPVVTQRSLVQDTRLKENKLNRWQKILTEAAEQSHRGRVPELAAPLTWTQAIDDAARADLALVAWAKASRPLRDILTDAQSIRSLALFIGPEGGFTAAEVKQAAGAGIQSFSLGPRILRTETAAVVASALALYELEPGP